MTHGDGNFADSVAVADFNKDGNLDLAVSYLEDNAVRVLTSGNGQFNAAVAYPVGKQPYWIASGDLNGDGYPDLVTANTTDGTVSVLLNNKNGTFAAAVPYTVGKQPYQVAIGDLNGDGILTWPSPTTAPIPFPSCLVRRPEPSPCNRHARYLRRSLRRRHWRL